MIVDGSCAASAITLTFTFEGVRGIRKPTYILVTFKGNRH